ETQQETRLRIGDLVAHAHRPDDHVVCVDDGVQLVLGNVRAGDGEVKADVRGQSSVAGREEVQRLPQLAVALAVDKSGTAQVLVELALLDEGGERQLGD